VKKDHETTIGEETLYRKEDADSLAGVESPVNVAEATRGKIFGPKSKFTAALVLGLMASGGIEQRLEQAAHPSTSVLEKSRSNLPPAIQKLEELALKHVHVGEEASENQFINASLEMIQQAVATGTTSRIGIPDIQSQDGLVHIGGKKCEIVGAEAYGRSIVALVDSETQQKYLAAIEGTSVASIQSAKANIMQARSVEELASLVNVETER